MIKLDKEYIAISTVSKSFVTLTDDEIDICEGHDIKRCQNFPLVNYANHKNCLKAIFDDDLQ